MYSIKWYKYIDLLYIFINLHGLILQNLYTLVSLEFFVLVPYKKYNMIFLYEVIHADINIILTI